MSSISAGPMEPRTPSSGVQRHQSPPLGKSPASSGHIDRGLEHIDRVTQFARLVRVDRGKSVCLPRNAVLVKDKRKYISPVGLAFESESSFRFLILSLGPRLRRALLYAGFQ